MRRAIVGALLAFGLAGALPAAEPAAPTFCAEWVEQSREGYERLTLFADRTLVWKRNAAAPSSSSGSA